MILKDFSYFWSVFHVCMRKKLNLDLEESPVFFLRGFIDAVQHNSNTDSYSVNPEDKRKHLVGMSTMFYDKWDLLKLTKTLTLIGKSELTMNVFKDEFIYIESCYEKRSLNMIEHEFQNDRWQGQLLCQLELWFINSFVYFKDLQELFGFLNGV